jgi:hypothetical protein
MDLREICYADWGWTELLECCISVLNVWLYYIQLVLYVGACLQNITQEAGVNGSVVCDK